MSVILIDIIFILSTIFGFTCGFIGVLLFIRGIKNENEETDE